MAGLATLAIDLAPEGALKTLVFWPPRLVLTVNCSMSAPSCGSMKLPHPHFDIPSTPQSA
jgi:hypothetical protein